MVALALLQYGQMDHFFGESTCNKTDKEWGNQYELPYPCYTPFLVCPVLIISAISMVITIAKIFQERKSSFQRHMWQHRPEDIFQIIVIILLIINVFVTKYLLIFVFGVQHLTTINSLNEL